MKPAVLFLIVLYCLAAECAFGQNNLHDIRLGNVKNSVTTYRKAGEKEVITTYNSILENPRMIYEASACTVTHFEITIIPRGADLYGPFNIEGNELPIHIIEYLRKKQDEGKPVKMAIDAFQLSCNGKKEVNNGTLFYVCK